MRDIEVKVSDLQVILGNMGYMSQILQCRTLVSLPLGPPEIVSNPHTNHILLPIWLRSLMHYSARTFHEVRSLTPTDALNGVSLRKRRQG